MYLQGASSSLPEAVQNAFYRSIKGFEHIEILRPAYAIDYDCVDPTSLEAVSYTCLLYTSGLLKSKKF